MCQLIFRNNVTRTIAVLLPTITTAAIFYRIPFIDWIQSFLIFAIFIIGVFIQESPPDRKHRTWPTLITFQWAGTLAERSCKGRKHAKLLNVLVADALNIVGHGLLFSGLGWGLLQPDEFSRPTLAMLGMLFWALVVYYPINAVAHLKRGKHNGDGPTP